MSFFFHILLTIKRISLFVALIISIITATFIGTIVVNEAKSFVGPTQPTGAGYGPDVGVIGDPTTGIPGASTLFAGQKKIYDEIVARCP